jgi:hypothetical protein
MRRYRYIPQLAAMASVVLALVTCADPAGIPVPGAGTASLTTELASPPPPVLLAAGDIASCDRDLGDVMTANLINTMPEATVLALGDNAYDNATAAELATCYERAWGHFKGRTRPAMGNHEYQVDPTPSFDYFGDAAWGFSRPNGYYSFDLGEWHIIVLNDEIPKSTSSPQVQWLVNDLAQNQQQCTLTVFHSPRWWSVPAGGTLGISSSRKPIWTALYQARADVVLNGHRHHYERFALQDPDGNATPEGLRQFIVGTGGSTTGAQPTVVWPNSQAQHGGSNQFGVLKLTLHPDRYDWQFIPVGNNTFTDQGTTTCHNVPDTPGVPSASESSVSAGPATVEASGGSSASTITVTARDASGDPVAGANVVLAATGSGNTVTQPADPTDASGVATGSVSSTAAGTKTISASISGVAITETADVTVTAGPADGSQSTVAASPPSIVAGGGSSTVTVTVKDAFGNPVSGATVDLAATGSGNSLTQPSGTTSASGVATGTLSSTVAEAKTVSATAGGTPIVQTATVTVTAAVPVTHTLLTTGTDLVNKTIYTTDAISPAPNTLVTVAVMSYRSPNAISPMVTGGGMSSWEQVASVDFEDISLPKRRMLIFRALSAAPGSGPITIRFTNSVGNCEWIVSQWGGVETGGVNGSGAIGQTGSNRADAGSNGLVVSLGALGNANNVAYGVFGVNSQVPAITPGTGFTEITEQVAVETSRGDLQAEWAVNRSTVNATWTNLKGGALAVEIKAGTGP